MRVYDITSSLLHVDFLFACVLDLAADVPDAFTEHIELCTESRHVVLAHLATPFSRRLRLVIHVEEDANRRETCVSRNNKFLNESFSRLHLLRELPSCSS